jgi:hypothetical protein
MAGFNLGALGAVGSGIVPGYQQGQYNQAVIALQQIQRQQALLKLQQEQQQQRSLPQIAGAINSWANLPIPGATPMPAAIGPGQPSMPGAPTPPVPAGGYNGPAPMPSPSPGGPINTSPMPGSPTPGQSPSSALQRFSPTSPIYNSDLKTLWRQLKAANPGMDNVTVMQALGQMQHLMGPEAKQQYDLMNLGVKLSGQQNTLDVSKNRIDAAMDRLQFLEGQVNNRQGNSLGARQTAAEARRLVALQNRATSLGLDVSDNDDATSLQAKISRAARSNIGAKDATAAVKNNPDHAAFRQAVKGADEAHQSITDILKRNKGVRPAPGTPDDDELSSLIKQRQQYEADKDAAYKRLRAAGHATRLGGYNKMHDQARQAASQPESGRKENPARPQSQDDFDALPDGAVYIDPDDGKIYQK